jgi:hypothetical protein
VRIIDQPTQTHKKFGNVRIIDQPTQTHKKFGNMRIIDKPTQTHKKFGNVRIIDQPTQTHKRDGHQQHHAHDRHHSPGTIYIYKTEDVRGYMDKRAS